MLADFELVKFEWVTEIHELNNPDVSYTSDLRAGF